MEIKSSISRWIYKVPLRLKSLLQRKRAEDELDEELKYHIERKTEEYAAKGLRREDARRQALLEMGGIEKRKEECRDARGFAWLESLWQDLRFGARMLAKSPGLTILAIFGLALGTSTNTAVFSAFNATALRPIQSSDPNRIVAVYRSAVGDVNDASFSYPDYRYFREHNQSFEGLFAAANADISVSDLRGASSRNAPAGGITSWLGIRFFEQLGGTAEVGRAAMVSENYFSALGIPPFMGRGFADRETERVAMLSYDFWARSFQSDPTVVGKTILLNGKPFTVIGITPKDFIGTYPNAPSVWLLISVFPEVEVGRDPLRNSNDECCAIYGRLRRGATRDAAQAELSVLADEMRRSHSSGSLSGRPVTISVESASPFGGHPGPQIIIMLIALMSAVGLVLLIACANVAGLQLARSAARRKEISVRLALGASRGRLIQQLLIEASLLAVIAGAAGLFGSWIIEAVLESSVAASLPSEWGFLALNVTPDLRVFAFTLAVSLGAGILFGLAPAVEASNPDLASASKQEGASFAGFEKAGRGQRLREFFIAAQVAVCLILLIAAGLLARGAVRAVRLDPGFETKKILALDFNAPPGVGYDQSKMSAIVQRAVQLFKTLPGVAGVTEGRVPLGGGLRSARVFLDASARDSNVPAPVLYYSYVSPNYFETLSVPILRGRTFTEDEARSGAPVTVISEATAKTLWPDQDPLGKRVTLDASGEFHDPQQAFPREALQVIGVSQDMRTAWLNEVDPGFFALPLAPDQYAGVMIRAQNDPKGLLAEVARETKEADANVVVYAETLDGLVTTNPAFVLSRVATLFSTVVGILGLVLATVGIYGMVSYVVALRTHEVGVRMALGAGRGDVVGLFVRQSAKPVLVGVFVGIVGSIAVSHFLSALLFGISSLDPVAFGGVSLFLMTVALTAAYLPARRATSVDPMVALRYE